MHAKVTKEFKIVYPNEVHGRRHVPGDVITDPAIAAQAIGMGVAEKHDDGHAKKKAEPKPAETKSAEPRENK